jgi:2-keto-3-deoxy-L-rhamnonate aldolase RhmA
MDAGGFKRALQERKPVVGTWLQINNATAAEVLANAGYDWISLDVEHTDIGIESLTSLLRGMHGRGAAPIARVTTNDVIEIRRSLDMGAAGVLVPFISSGEEARKAVTAAKYPPAGVRGYSFCRANEWGADFARNAEAANDETSVILMIESKEGAENIEDIVSVDGVDAVFIGPYDLSGSFGIPGQTDAAPVRAACGRVVRACEDAGKSVGLLLGDPKPNSIRRVVDDGYTLICIGIDTLFLDHAARAARRWALEALKGVEVQRRRSPITRASSESSQSSSRS